MVVEDFSSKIVFLDTAPLIYFIEGHSRYQPVLIRLFDLNDRGNFTFITTCIILLEVLVKPFREGKTSIAQQYRDILTRATGIEMLEVISSVFDLVLYISYFTIYFDSKNFSFIFGIWLMSIFFLSVLS